MYAPNASLQKTPSKEEPPAKKAKVEAAKKSEAPKTPQAAKPSVNEQKTATPGAPFLYGYRTDNNKPLVTYRFLNLSSLLDLSPGVFF